MIAILDYGAGNIGSLCNALHALNAPYVISADPEIISAADKIICPGQGRAGQVMSALRDVRIIELLQNGKKPFLGICIGMHILFDRSEEDDVACLGIIPGTVRKFTSSLPVPHMGWNRVTSGTGLKPVSTDTPSLLSNIPNDSFFYFAHSFVCEPSDPETIMATTRYDVEIPAIVQKDNFIGVQFHPEKSGKAGMQFLKNFLAL